MDKLVATLALCAIASTAAAAAPDGSASSAGSGRHPPISVIHGVLLTTSAEHFGDHQGSFAAAAEWHESRLHSLSPDRPAPYLACAPPQQNSNNNREDENAGRVRPRSDAPHLQGLLGSGAAGARMVSTSEEHGVCVLATTTPGEAQGVFGSGDDSSSSSVPYKWVAIPSALKIAPNLLKHGGADSSSTEDGRGRRLSTTHGDRLHRSKPQRSAESSGNDGRNRSINGDTSGPSPVIGLTVELAPGVLAAAHRRDDRGGGAAGDWYESAEDLVREWREELMSSSLNLHEMSYWSSGWSGDAAGGDSEEGRRPGAGERLARDWTRAADVLGEIGGGEGGPAIGDVCAWDALVVFHTDHDLLTLRGIDHLLPGGRGAGGNEGEEADELQVACFMGLLSFLAARPEVMRISAARQAKMLNAAAYRNLQSATLTETPMTDSGLDGTGEVIQVVDTGLDYNSCYFVDEDGQEVAHGHFFEEVGVEAGALSSWYPSWDYDAQLAQIFTGGDYNFDLGRRKIVQYINLIRQDTVLTNSSMTNSTSTNSTSANSTDPVNLYGASWATSDGDQYPWISAAEFAEDDPAGHGTHTAGSAAGAVVSAPPPMTNAAFNTTAITELCVEERNLSCVGGCIDLLDPYGDDLVSSISSVYWYLGYDALDLDRMCPRFDCDGFAEEYCLSDDTTETLVDHGGVARGAKLSIFDILDNYWGIGISMVGNAMWEPAMEAGSKLHSNSWGIYEYCDYSSENVMYDDFMYRNPENLLIFAAGNDGDYYGSCTMGSPAIAKNILAIGASTSGPGRVTFTAEDGTETDGSDRAQDIDTLAYFSSRGPTLDDRIKPEVVAPGDMVYSAAGGGTGNYTCRLWNYPGTSMSTPLVAGAAALIRQYFKNETFYVADVTERGFCDDFGCEAFAPSAATLKAMLINSANLMGGSSEPDGDRGFGRVHLEPGMPLRGEGQGALFVADSSYTNTPALTLTEYSFDVNASANLDFRATLSWIDPPATSFSSVQLVHDLDLSVYGPTGLRYTMWRSGMVDAVNNNERVIITGDEIYAESTAGATGTSTSDQASATATTSSGDNSTIGSDSSSSFAGSGDDDDVISTWTVRVWSKQLAGNETQSYSLVVTGAISPPTSGDGNATTSGGGSVDVAMGAQQQTTGDNTVVVATGGAGRSVQGGCFFGAAAVAVAAATSVLWVSNLVLW